MVKVLCVIGIIFLIMAVIDLVFITVLLIGIISKCRGYWKEFGYFMYSFSLMNRKIKALIGEINGKV